MAAITLAEIGRLAKVVVDQTNVDPGDVVGVHLALPLPSDRLELGSASAYTAHVSWRVTKVEPQADNYRTTANNPAGAIIGTEYIAPGGLHGLSTAVSLLPPIGDNAPASQAYWVIASVTLSWASDLTAVGAAAPAGAILQTSIEKTSPQITAARISDAELKTRVLDLFKIVAPAAPLEPGSEFTARLRPKGAEDASWDVGASDVLLQHDWIRSSCETFEKLVGLAGGHGNESRARLVHHSFAARP
jgi:hypothetical protein